MNSSRIETSTEQMTARCLFPESQAKQRPAVSFSIGDIMRSVGLPAQHDAAKSPRNTHYNPVQLHYPDVRGFAPSGPVSKLHMNHLLSQDTSPHMYVHNSAFSYQADGRYPNSIDSTPASRLTTPQRTETLLRIPAQTDKSSESPGSNTSGDLVDVEDTSPNGSTSSGFHSNPSPNISSHSSSSPETQSSKKLKDLLPPANNRTSYTQKQVRRLKQVFAENSYPDIEMYEQLSEELSIPMAKLRVWFQNRRARNKRRMPETQGIQYSLPIQAMSTMLPSPGYGLLPQYPIMPYSLYPYPASPAPMMPPNIYYGQPYPLSMYPHN